MFIHTALLVAMGAKTESAAERITFRGDCDQQGTRSRSTLRQKLRSPDKLTSASKLSSTKACGNDRAAVFDEKLPSTDRQQLRGRSLSKVKRECKRVYL